MFTRLLCGVAFAALSISVASADNLPADKSKVTLAFDHALPNVPGKSMKGVLVEYKPGDSSPCLLSFRPYRDYGGNAGT